MWFIMAALVKLNKHHTKQGAVKDTWIVVCWNIVCSAMTRHGKNATNSAVYSYHERRRDASASGYGTDHARLGKDSIKGFDCCSITLQPCTHPVVTKEGWLFDKEALLKYILDKKTEYRKKLAAYEAQSTRQISAMRSEVDSDRDKQRKNFEKAEKAICSNKDGESSKNSSLTAFWVPSLTPAESETKLTRPDKTVLCPMSGRPLRLRDLIDVKFTPLAPSEADANKSLVARSERYKCPVTNDVLCDATPSAVLKTTGDVVTVDCVERIIRKDMLHPLTGEKLEDSDIIYLQRGGTGYAAANEKLKASKFRPTIALS